MTDLSPVSQDTLDLLTRSSSATLTSVLNGFGLWNTFMHNVHPLKPGMRMAGPAFTMRYIPSREDIDHVPMDNLTDIQRIGIERIESGEVLVIDARGDTRAGVMGNILATRIERRGAVGVVTDGCYRDSPGIAEVGIAAYARDMNAHTNKTVHHPIDIQQPIGCGGVAVFPGDIVVGDGEGIVVVPSHLAEKVAEKAAAQEEKEEFILWKIQQGASIIGVYPPDEKTLAEYEQWRNRSLKGEV
ncbi:MAG: ribonuclease activity regulator RraA [candidate division Zixibacteria bacterium]|nr:ribonuclease activity regulator RraA [candidate division Zixibacteria bacterium]